MRIGYVFDDPMAPIDPDLMPLFEKVIHSLERAGATLKPGWPNGVKLAELNQTFSFLVGAVVYALEPSQTRAELMEEIKAMPNDMAKGALSSHADWMHQNLRRLAYRQQWRDYFQNIDVFLSPVAFTTAIPHTHNGSFGTRSVRSASGERRHVELLNWIGPATVTGCPATAAPIGNTGSGLPVAVQIMGPFWEDATPIAFAELLAREIGGFTPPPGFQS
jgi:amidase